MKRVVIFVVILICVFSLFAIIKNIPKDYSYEYKCDKFNIVEKYDKDNKVYSFNISNKSIEYDYSVEEDYHTERGLINKVKVSGECINVSLDKIDNFSICLNENGYYTKYYDKKIESKKSDSYEKIDIYDLNGHTYMIWNYNNFLGLSEDKKEKIDIFDDDHIKLNFITKYKDKLVVADYNEKYSFKKLYVIDPYKMKTDTLKLDTTIYLNGYFLGEYDDYLYVFDMQEKQEYKIDMEDGLVYKNKPEVLKNGEMVSSSVIKLNKNQETFTEKVLFNYVLEDSKLYYNTPVSKILVSNMNVEKIVYQDKKEGYFLVGDTLYYVHIDKGIKKLLSYSEWQFNNSNIYIF